MKSTVFACAALLIGGTCQAALFSGPSSFTTLPISQLGPVTNNLVLTDNANGFVVSGQVIITLPPTSSQIAGTLAYWIVDRPLDATYGTGNLVTTTQLSGFSAPPPGIVLNTSGVVQSFFTNYPVASLSQIPITLAAGVDVPPWNNLSINSSTFSYVSGGVNYLRQRFDVDGIYDSGPGGSWVVDVPVSTFATVVPEPSTMLLGGLGFLGLILWAWRKRAR